MWGPRHSGHRQLSRKLAWWSQAWQRPFPDPPGTAPGEDGLGLCPWGQKAGHRLPDGAGWRPCRGPSAPSRRRSLQGLAHIRLQSIRQTTMEFPRASPPLCLQQLQATHRGSDPREPGTHHQTQREESPGRPSHCVGESPASVGSKKKNKTSTEPFIVLLHELRKRAARTWERNSKGSVINPELLSTPFKKIPM